MANKELKRVIRSRNLTSEEAGRDEQIRRKVQQEFPPAHPLSSPVPDSISETLKRAIKESDRSVSQISKAALVSHNMLTQFLSGQRDIRVTTADRLATVLGLKLTVG